MATEIKVTRYVGEITPEMVAEGWVKSDDKVIDNVAVFSWDGAFAEYKNDTSTRYATFDTWLQGNGYNLIKK